MDEKKLINMLLSIGSLGLLVAGVIFLGLNIAGSSDTNYLCMALGCICIANLFNVIRGQFARKNKEE